MGLIAGLKRVVIQTKNPKDFGNRLISSLDAIHLGIVEDGGQVYQVGSARFELLACDAVDDLESTVDGVKDIAFHVKNLSKVLDNLAQVKGTLVSLDNDKAVILSCLGRLRHTLSQVTIDHQNASDQRANRKQIIGIDHITLACEIGDSNRVISWYERVFDMKRAQLNNSESSLFGIDINFKTTGMKMSAFDYWHCSENVLHAPDSCDDMKFVLVEPLPSTSPNQVTRFLNCNMGPGVQHIAFLTRAIMQTIRACQGTVSFQMPPSGYYEEILASFNRDNNFTEEFVASLQASGALLDCERDQEGTVNTRKYILQIFTKPLFPGQETLFFEFIQRHDHAGFGEGNIIALWKSIERNKI